MVYSLLQRHFGKRQETFLKTGEFQFLSVFVICVPLRLKIIRYGLHNRFD